MLNGDKNTKGDFIMAVGQVLRFGAAGVVGYGVYQVGKKVYEHKDEIKQKAKEVKQEVKKDFNDFNAWQKKNRKDLIEFGLLGIVGKHILDNEREKKAAQQKVVEVQ